MELLEITKKKKTWKYYELLRILKEFVNKYYGLLGVRNNSYECLTIATNSIGMNKNYNELIRMLKN